jgi:3-oxoacyl-[acyl-carrier protein] reductase
MKDWFEGTVAIVTGGGTGVGRQVSLMLASLGVKVAIIYSRSEQQARQTVDEIVRLSGTAIAVQANVAVDAQVIAAIKTVIQAFGQIDFLVNNAGITRQLPFDELDAISDDAWDDLYAVNVKGAFYCSRAAAPYLRRSKRAAIFNVGSVAGETGYGSSIPYAVSKAAMHGLTKSLARALAPQVRVNCLAPGAIDTRWWAENHDKMKKLAGHVALNRVSSPNDIARSALMLLASESMTGQIVKADNGQTL